MSRVNRAWHYPPNPGDYDEMLAPDGTLRPHWKPVIEPLEEVGEAGFALRWQEGRRLIHENGTTYNVYSDPQNLERRWPLDPIPLVLDGAEWAGIERAVVQRATLLNTILADLYGPRQLLLDGKLPPELLFPNPAFLRSCCHLPVPGGVYLHIYAADLARSADGRWWVIADRTQAPSGAGYALENRLVTARVLTDVFRTAGIHRLAPFFKAYREGLRRLAPGGTPGGGSGGGSGTPGGGLGNRENPRIVVLTPGPYNETYFEHAFLARYLGFTLVEGGDLTVRDNRVFLKTLGGLLQVDVIVRRQDDTYCDPLELRSDSMLGVPGLVQAVRSGTVTVANALGSGLVESAAPASFLPTLCRHILGEDLKMPAVATWWCGEESACAYVTNHLSNLVIKPAFPTAGVQPIFGVRLTAAEREALLDRIRAAPGMFVAQEQVALSTVPVWEDGPLRPRHLVLRVFAVASNGSYAMMPGGLTRVTTSLDSLVASMQGGGGSKDTWVAAQGPTSQLSLLPSAPVQLDVSRATFDLPSRVADNLFWLGRYMERVEPVVRVARAILPRLLQDADLAAAGVATGTGILAGLGYIPRRTDGHAGSPERDVFAVIYGSETRDTETADTENSLPSSMHQVRRVGWLLRDRISTDAWRILNQLDEQLSSAPPPDPLRLSGAQALLDQAIGTLSAFSGLAMESMTRGDGWRFLDIGRRLERAWQMVSLIRHGLGFESAHDSGQLEILLEIADSSITYRSRYLTSMQADLVLDLLLLDEANPRSLAYQLVQLREHVEHLPGSRSLIRRPAEARIAISLLTAVQLVEIRELACVNSQGRRNNLESLLNRLTGELRLLSETLTREYFNQALPSRQFGDFVI
ncbi:MAG TPA: circularly permuted type 2 ATP-grasp protein [Candidatus Acidoferrales bacterium]|nr:circularly permuted type 2 ATP-grasp protein [Candidatus Acidoferrales bacterium]